MRPSFTKRRLINWGCVGPALIALALFVAVIVGVIAIVRHTGQVTSTQAPRATATPRDVLSRELARCQSLGRKAEDDSSCLAAWAENRRRFFDSGSESNPASQQ